MVRDLPRRRHSDLRRRRRELAPVLGHPRQGPPRSDRRRLPRTPQSPTCLITTCEPKPVQASPGSGSRALPTAAAPGSPSGRRLAKPPSPTVDGGWVTDRFGPGWGDNPQRARRRAHQSRYLLRNRLRPHHAHHRRRQDLARRHSRKYAVGRIDHHRPRRHHQLRRPLRPVRPQPRRSSATPISALFQSQDGGASWTRATADGVPRRWRNTTYWMEFDPEVTRPHLGRLQRHPRSAAAEDVAESRSPGPTSAASCVSDDGGNTWRASNQGMPQTAGHPHPARSPQPRRRAHALRHGASDAASTSPPTAARPGR